MLKHHFVLLMVFGLGILVTTPFVACAQRGGGHGGGHGGGGHGGGAHVGGGHAGGSHVGVGHIGGAHVGGGWGHAGGVYNHGYYHGGGFNHGYGNYYPGAFGSYANPFWYGYGGIPYYDYGAAGPDYGYSSPGYYDNGYYDSGYNVYPATPYRSVFSLPSVRPVESSNYEAEIDVLLPRADAKVWVDGNPMSAATGTQRSFLSPPLEPGYSYSYRVTASWMENGQEVRVERMVPVSPGRRSVVDFSRSNATLRMPPAEE